MRRKRCLFCGSCRCYHRIYTEDRRFDEVACLNHFRDLEDHANATLGNPGAERIHQTSSEPLCRDFVKPAAARTGDPR